MGKHTKKTKQQKLDQKRARDEREEATIDEGKIIELQALELRARHLSEQHAKTVANIRMEEVNKRKTELIIDELKNFRNKAPDGRLFKGVGRAYFLSDEKEIFSDLNSKIEKCTQEIPRHRVLQAQFEIRMKQEQENIKNLASEMKDLRL